MTDRYDLLPVAVRRMHDFSDTLEAVGTVDVARLDEGLAGWLVRRLGLPASQAGVPARVRFRRGPDYVHLHRDYGGDVLETTFFQTKTPGFLLERFGPFWLLVEGVCSVAGLTFFVRKFWLWRRIRLPLWIAPRIDAREFERDGVYAFEVEIGLPPFGRLIRYEGELRPIARSEDSSQPRDFPLE